MKHILYFYKNSCGPCNEIKPFIDKLSKTNKIDYININERDTLADKLNIMYTPTIAIIDSETKSMVKYEGFKQIKQVINENLI
jgi:thiol-disulfide isomerase/thioredoxin